MLHVFSEEITFFMSRRNLQGLMRDSLSVLSSHPTLGTPAKPILEEPLAHVCGLLVYSNFSTYSLTGWPGFGSKRAELNAKGGQLGV
jgi:hypothetical protein